jgi:putative PEP-CTERM system histidine kinase
MNTATLLAYAGALFAGALAFTVIWSERRSLVNVTFVTGILLLGLESMLTGFAHDAPDNFEVLRWESWRLLCTSLVPGVWLFFSLSYGRGNHGEFLKRWKYTLAFFFLAPPAVVLVMRSLYHIEGTVEATGPMQLGLGLGGYLLNLLFLVGVVLILMNLERTFRASVGTMRWRIKFMILGLVVLFAVRAYTSAQVMIQHAFELPLEAVDSAALFVGGLLLLRSLFREGHFAMDIYPSHAVLQSSLTVTMAGIYLLVIGVLAKIVNYFGGSNSTTLTAFLLLVALGGLTVLLLSDRVRLLTSRFISRHFQRPSYDYRTVWRNFTEATAACVSPTELAHAAVKSMTDIFQALSVTMWLVDEKKEQLVFAASTFLSEARASELRPDKDGMTILMKGLQEQHDPLEIESQKEAWVEILRQCHPDEFRKGSGRVCLPMVGGDEVLGFVILGDRVGGTPFTWQDFDLLKCIGDQIAAGLLNTRLSQKLLQAKELEAFQTMSAFFVHDMKNTANTLNLMLQNLPVHFDDPAFRADALRGVSKTVAHINRLIGRLGSIRHELQIKPVAADLNEMVAKALAGWEEVAGINLEKDLQPLPRVEFDTEQMLKVTTNLIFNAREAVSKSGVVQIKTMQNNGWAVLAVSDNGCGMSKEFVSRSLFRPFQTTKKNGLGIGMFQSKMIVEAHKGRIEVESEPGKGATFRVWLPLPKNK